MFRKIFVTVISCANFRLTTMLLQFARRTSFASGGADGAGALRVGTNAKEQCYRNQSGSLADLACAL